MIGDLTSVANVKSWLNITGSDSDALLQRLISGWSNTIKKYISKDVLTATYTEVYNGNGKNRMILKNQPIISISSLVVGAQVIPAISAWPNPGYTIDGDTGIAVLLQGYAFNQGIQNVAITYQAGYQSLLESHTIPATPFQITAADLADFWVSDVGVTYNGVAFTKVASSPAALQYSVSSAGLYTFNTADSGKDVGISYNCVPRGLEMVIMELVGERYRAKANIGKESVAMQGETTSFQTKDMNSSIKMALNQYRTLAYAV